MRPGSVCLWDSRTPHGNFPNSSERWRLCQYLGLHPAPTAALQPGLCRTRQEYMRIQLENGRLPPSATETSEARKLAGLEPWEPAELGPEHTMSTLTIRQIGLWDDYPELGPTTKPSMGGNAFRRCWGRPRGFTVAVVVLAAAVGLLAALTPVATGVAAS